jgi:heat-inducible transcriptional repressor
MNELDHRKQLLLQAIVDIYVGRAEPVASEWLASHHDLGVRSATIRNEMAAMTEMGYLRQPHTSAGRVPSDMGYRYYVDRLMSWGQLSQVEATAIKGIGRLSEGQVEELLTQTCRVLTSLTRLTSVALPPSQKAARVRQIHLVQMAQNQVLMVIVMEGGQIHHRFVELPQRLTPFEVATLSTTLDEMFRAVPEGAPVTLPEAPAEMRPLQHSLRQLVSAAERTLCRNDEEFVVEGTSHMLEQPEFREADRVEPIIRLLEERKSAYEMLRNLVKDHPTAVVIGAEHPSRELQECSLVAARYRVGERMSGWIGLIGPTRMHYARAVPVVDLAARALSRALTRLSGSTSIGLNE